MDIDALISEAESLSLELISLSEMSKLINNLRVSIYSRMEVQSAITAKINSDRERLERLNDQIKLYSE